MPGLRPDVDPDGLQEFSVVFTDRSVNHMSQKFQAAMRDISGMLREVYHASAVAIVPGGGTYAMEAVARQFAAGKHALIVRNGWFSFRWTQIFDMGGFAAKTTRGDGAANRQCRALALCPAAHRRSCSENPRRKTRCRLCPACGNIRRTDPARRLHHGHGRRRS